MAFRFFYFIYCTIGCVCTVYFIANINKTTTIERHLIDVEERGVKLHLVILDTPGFNDSLNDALWFV